MAGNSDVFVTFGGDTGALEAAIAAIKSQMAGLSRDMRSAANDFNKVGATVDSELGQKLKGLGAQLAGAKDRLKELQGAAVVGGDAVKRMADNVGNAAYEYGPWTGAHVQLAQAIGETLVRSVSAASTGVKVMTVAFGAAAVAAAAMATAVLVSRETIAAIGELAETARLAAVPLEQLQNLERAAVVSGTSREGMDTALQGLAKAANEATRSENDFSKILKANNVALTDGQGHLRSTMALLADYANLVQRAKTEQDKLVLMEAIGSGKDMISFFAQGSEKIRQLEQDAQKTGSALDSGMVQRAKDFDTAWNRTIDGFGMRWKAAIMDILSLFEKLRAAIPQPATEAKSAGAGVGGMIGDVIRQKDGKAPVWAGGVGGYSFGTANYAGSTDAAMKRLRAGMNPKDDASYTKIPKDDDDSKSKSNADRLAQETARDQIAAAKATFDSERSLIDEKAKLHLISTQEQIAETRRALDEEVAAEKVALQEELKTRGLKPEQIKAINNQILQLERQHKMELQKLHFQEVEDSLKEWDRMVDTMASSLSSSLSGMIEGTTTFRAAMAQLARGVEREFIKMGVDMAANAVKASLVGRVQFAADETAKTGAAMAGAAARTGIATGEASAGAAATLAAVAKSITASASEAFAGVFGFLAPVMGPLAAGPAAAAQGLVMGQIGKYDIGAWSLDRDQLAMVHKNEMIMPAAQAGAFRQMLTNAANGGGTGGGGGGDTHHYNSPVNINTTGQGIQALIKADPKGAAQAIAMLVRHGHLKFT